MRLLSILAALLLLAGCDLFADDEGGSFEVVGTVVDAETGAPLSGIGVTLRDPSFSYVHPIRTQMTTGANGRFRLAYSSGRLSGYTLNVNDGPYNDSYTAYRDSFYPDPGDVLDYGEIPISRHRTIEVTGTVVLDETGEPIDGLRVAIESYSPSSGYFTSVANTTTDGEGTFLVRFERAISGITYRVLVNAPWYRDPPTPYTDRTFDVEAGETLELGVIELSHVGD